MRWTPGGSSDDVEDRRSESGGGFRPGGIHLGLGGIVILFILSLIFKRDFLSLVSTGSMDTGTTVAQSDPARDQQEQPLVQFVTFVLNDTQNTWSQILPQQGVPYRHAKLVLFRDAYDSACGMAQSATGPFYCPEDEKVYIDLGFYDELKQRFGAPGEFAEAYVLAHEIGHHVQKLLGIEAKDARRTAKKPGGSQPAFGRSGTAGRLLRRRLGPLHPGAQPARPRRRGLRASGPPPQSETIASSACPEARSIPKPSPTEAPPSACSGSNAAFRTDQSPPAIRFSNA